ncbi:hypothetical protein ABGB16_31195 [Micromonospora sp. B11E3]|uniref:hypothetical protein n=1 Tax=Micromonospora sp. B11E3 TaxID=3153562 RepID=UPI00325CDACA
MTPVAQQRVDMAAAFTLAVPAGRTVLDTPAMAIMLVHGLGTKSTPVTTRRRSAESSGSAWS